MKADFEKGTKVCSKCKRELPIEMFSKCKSNNDGLERSCKQCNKAYCKKYNNKMSNTFSGQLKRKRGQTNILKRDYELTEEQIKKRAYKRRSRNHGGSNVNPHGILVWYSEKLNELDKETYKKIIIKEYSRQRRCAVRGYIGRIKPSEHFLFDFDLEQMLKSNVYEKVGNEKKYITKWWDGEIRHWTVNDGIWKK